MGKVKSKQELYAKNLEREGLGLAIYNPRSFIYDEEANEKCIGDIRYFNADGTYEWIANAWHISVMTCNS